MGDSTKWDFEGTIGRNIKSPAWIYEKPFKLLREKGIWLGNKGRENITEKTYSVGYLTEKLKQRMSWGLQEISKLATTITTGFLSYVRNKRKAIGSIDVLLGKYDEAKKSKPILKTKNIIGECH